MKEIKNIAKERITNIKNDNKNTQNNISSAKTRHKRITALVLCAGLLLGALTGCGGGSSEKDGNDAANGSSISGKVSTDGSTSMEKVIGILGEAFTELNPDVNFTYNPTGSGTGITSVSDGICDIGLSSRALKDEEKAKGLVATTLALDGIAVIVNPENPVKDLSTDQLTKIFTGEITDWSDVGGNAGEIVLIGREAGSGTRDGFESITKTSEKCQYRQELTSTGDVITTVSQNPLAIGYASLASVKDSVTAISVNGVTPSEASVQDGSYPIQRPFIMVTKADTELSPAAKAFFDYATSAEVNELISKAGAVPVSK